MEWALIQGDIGLPLTHAQLRYIVQRILQAASDHTPLGKHWIQHFLIRNPSLKTLKARPLVNTRINGASPSNIEYFFKLLQSPAI